MFLAKNQLEKLIKQEKLIISPLLDNSQINEMTIDFRLGYDFLVSIQGRHPYLNSASHIPTDGAFYHFFQETRRNFGDTFLFHPGQTVLGATLEYVKLPENVSAILSPRSSYNRLGINLSTVIQPGYCGCFSLEITNTSHNPIKVRVGATMFQARFVKTKKTNYFSKERKYICSVKPEISGANKDQDLKLLELINKPIS
ncbi:dCTP deaminase [Maribellus luteus]|uniref:dCTP deaminase n=1 Tax=Maribellus luteus TaxID=2305463 RepID=A0A399T4M0_9BACT|nr:dCTP deaminase [Maribellus luteus]RIJ48823.1 dCTP deaminase [Maribellus luteus]